MNALNSGNSVSAKLLVQLLLMCRNLSFVMIECSSTVLMTLFLDAR